MAIVVLQTNSTRLADRKSLVPNILKVLPEAPKGAATLVNSLGRKG
ncbi:hypothetical protein IQ273_21140 [Nodosilinea sp. LEGE 07298]|nr:hypothetical protein [Nodosilinea sp. LEGE 07298]MBE9111915.1 hypothetical protein [Nodosilinea sp. LEGE 07298]